MKKENASRLAEIALHTKEEYGLKKPALGQKTAIATTLDILSLHSLPSDLSVIVEYTVGFSKPSYPLFLVDTYVEINAYYYGYC